MSRPSAAAARGRGLPGVLAGFAERASGLATLGVLLLAWELLARWRPSPLMPPASAVGAALADLFSRGGLAVLLGHTVLSALEGLGLAALIMLPLGLAMGASRRADALLSPSMELARPLPPATLIPALLALLGLGPAMRLTAVTFAAAFPVLLATAAAAARQTPRELLDCARSLGAGHARVVLGVLLPASLPGWATGLRTALPMALIVAVTAELLGGGDGAGALLLRLQRSFRMPEMLAVVLALGLSGAALGLLLDFALGRLLFWRKSATGLGTEFSRTASGDPVHLVDRRRVEPGRVARRLRREAAGGEPEPSEAPCDRSS